MNHLVYIFSISIWLRDHKDFCKIISREIWNLNYLFILYLWFFIWRSHELQKKENMHREKKKITRKTENRNKKHIFLCIFVQRRWRPKQVNLIQFYSVDWTDVYDTNNIEQNQLCIKKYQRTTKRLWLSINIAVFGNSNMFDAPQRQ